MYYKTVKNLSLANGIVGIVVGSLLIGIGIILFISFIWLIGMCGDDPTGDFQLSLAVTNSYQTLAVVDIIMSTIFLLIPKLALIILGIVGIFKFKKVKQIPQPLNVFFIISGAISLIPLLEFFSGILALICGILYLTSRNQFLKHTNLNKK